MPVASTSTQASKIELDWTLSAESIEALATRIIAQSKRVQDEVAAVPPEQRTFETVIVPLAHSDAWESTMNASCYFPQYVSSDKAIRDSSIAANKAIETHEIESGMRVDVYAAVKDVWDKWLAQNPSGQVKTEDERLLKKMELQFRRNGLALSAEDRAKLTALKKRLSDLCIDFSKNINDDVTSVAFSAEDLDGLPADFIDGLTVAGGADDQDKSRKLYAVTMKYPDLIPVLDRAKKEHVRRAVDIANTTRCKANVALLEEAVRVREEISYLLGYSNHAAFTLEERMAKSPDRVFPFLDDLAARLKPLAERDLTTLLKLKEKEKAESGEPFDGQINSWDFRYYNRLLVETEYQVDDQVVKEYFALESVTKNMLALYERVLGLRFTAVPVKPVTNTDNSQTGDHVVWHEDVQLFKVENQSDGGLVGHFYLDLFPREGKYTHAACFGLQPGCQLESQQRQYPVAAMVANFSKPSPGRPSLLKHNEVVTFYHELGHVMHQICSLTKWSYFHGTKVERDFVEAPSQMLENWCWEANVLTQLSAHYQRKDASTGEPERIPADLCAKLVSTKNVGAGLMNLRQIFFAMFDMTIHTQPASNVNTTAVYDKLRRSIAMIPNPEGTFPAATFGHVMGGYDAGYYGYLWSQVFSADMFYSRFKKEGVENAAVGSDYRQHILVPGGSKDGDDMLKSFLGREPSADAFLESIGLGK